MANTFDQVFAADPSNPGNVAQNASVLIFAPGDATKTPLTITTTDGQPLANPVLVNSAGFGPAFMHETLDRVAWEGAGFTGFFTSYDGMKNEAVAARSAADSAASSAATSAEDAAASAAAAEDAAALVGAPSDFAVQALINNTTSSTRGALNTAITNEVTAGNTYDPPSFTTLPSAYRTGMTYSSITTGGGWPFTGTAFTVKRGNTRIFQVMVNTQASATTLADMRVRYGYVDAATSVDVWGPLKRLAGPLDYNTGNTSELVATLPVPVNATDAHKRVMFSVNIPDLRVGELIQAMSEFQVTNDLGYNVMVMTQIILADSATAVVGTEITEGNGRNVTPAAHHDTYPKVGALRSAVAGNKYVNVVAWCAASNGSDTATITVDADYGRLSVIRY